MDVNTWVGKLFLVLTLATVALGVFATIDAAIRPAAAFIAAGKLTKPAWLAITGLSTVVTFIFGIVSLLGLPALVALLVYLVDVRPKVRAVTGGRPPSPSAW